MDKQEQKRLESKSGNFNRSIKIEKITNVSKLNQTMIYIKKYLAEKSRF